MVTLFSEQHPPLEGVLNACIEALKPVRPMEAVLKKLRSEAAELLGLDWPGDRVAKLARQLPGLGYASLTRHAEFNPPAVARAARKTPKVIHVSVVTHALPADDSRGPRQPQKSPFEQVPPHDVEAEAAALGGQLLGGHAIEGVFDTSLQLRTITTRTARRSRPPSGTCTTRTSLPIPSPSRRS